MSGQTKNVFVNAEFQIRRDTAENWEAENPILEAGEPALVVDENDKPKYLKIGDGKTTWSELKRFNYPDQEYNPESENAQSGKALAEATATKMDKFGETTYNEMENNTTLKIKGSRVDIATDGAASVTLDENGAQLRNGKSVFSGWKGYAEYWDFTDGSRLPFLTADPVENSNVIPKNQLPYQATNKQYVDKLSENTKEEILTYTNNTFAPAIKNTASGSAISVNDVSPIEHELKVKVNNLIYSVESVPVYGGGYTIYNSLPPGDIVISFDTEVEIINAVVLNTGTLVEECSLNKTDNHYECSVTIPKDENEYSFAITIGEDEDTIQNFSICFDVDLSSVTVSRNGKNLITYPYMYTTRIINGITLTDNGDGTITANGTATADVFFFMRNQDLILTKGTFFLSGCPSGGAGNNYMIYAVGYDNGKEVARYHDYGAGKVINSPVDSYSLSVLIYILKGNTVNNLTFKPQIEVGTTATEYEPYVEPQTATANSDGTVEGLTSVSPNMTLMTDTYGVEMDVTYNADTKLYIDNKIAKVSAAILNS